MQKVFAAASFAAAFVMAGSAAAADLAARGGLKDGPAWASTDILDVNNQICVQFAATDFRYKETGDPARETYGKLDTEAGWVPGVGVELALMRNWIVTNLYFDARYTYLNGKTDYVGGLQQPIVVMQGSGNDYGSVKQKNGAVVNDLDFRIGKGFEVQSNLMVTPYLGVGYHDWDRKVNGGEEYTNGYVGGGLLVQWAPVAGAVLSAHGMAGTTFGSHIDVGAGYGIDGAVMASRNDGAFSAPLGDSMIWKAGLSGDYALTRNIHLNAGVEWTTFRYGESALYNVDWFEPDSFTLNTTVKAGIGYSFGGDAVVLK
jgi:hypothetical protein